MSGARSGSEMQAARIAPGVGRQLRRLGVGRCVLGQEGWGGGLDSGFGDRARTEPRSPQLADKCAPGAPAARPGPPTLCQWGRSGE